MRAYWTITKIRKLYRLLKETLFLKYTLEKHDTAIFHKLMCLYVLKNVLNLNRITHIHVHAYARSLVRRPCWRVCVCAVEFLCVDFRRELRHKSNVNRILLKKQGSFKKDGTDVRGSNTYTSTLLEVMWAGRISPNHRVFSVLFFFFSQPHAILSYENIVCGSWFHYGN